MLNIRPSIELRCPVVFDLSCNGLFCFFFFVFLFLFLLPLIANKVDLEALERIRGFSTTMRYINRHYLSIYLSYLKLCACIDIGKGDIDPPLLGILCTFVNTFTVAANTCYTNCRVIVFVTAYVYVRML